MPTLSWDLFVIVVFTVIIAYSFIIGKENTLKVVIASYMAILTADALGNLFKEFFLASKPFTQFLQLVAINGEDKAMMLFKTVIFLAAIVAISIRGQFTVLRGRQGGVVGFITSMVFAFLSAGLIISALLVYASGGSFLGANFAVSSTLQPIYTASQLVKLMIDNANLWFSLPALAFVVWSFFGHREEQIEE
ncbi:MAG: hypothetical protein AAB592_02260 [Patescibacteria group bacterium]